MGSLPLGPVIAFSSGVVKLAQCGITQDNILNAPMKDFIAFTFSGRLQVERVAIETVSPEGTFCDTVQFPSGADDMQLI